MPHRIEVFFKKSRIHLSFFFVLFGIIGITAQTKMSAAEAKMLKEKVKAQAEATTTVISDFKQYKHIDFLSNDIESTGKLAFKAPDLVKWEYVKPFAYSILFKKEVLYIDDSGKKSNIDMGANKIFKQLNRLITASIKGDLFDTNEFNVAYYKNEGQDQVHFIPTDAQFSEFIKAFHITFDTNGEVQEVKMIEPSNDYTHIIFSNRVVNQPLSDAVFTQ